MREELTKLVDEVMYTKDSFEYKGVKFTSRCEDGNWYLGTDYLLCNFDYCTADGYEWRQEEVADAIIACFDFE